MGLGWPQLGALVGGLALAGCLAPVTRTATCTDCHGSSGDGAWVALGGLTDPTALGVGAHLAHVEPDGPASSAFPRLGCADCHLVPAEVGSEGHVDTPWPAEVGWSELGKVGGAFLPWDHGQPTCTVYCHGAGLTGGDDPTPTWNADPPGATGPDALGCGSCHGDPPPPPHPTDSACAGCHGPQDATTHLNGTLDFAEGASCEGCHGEGADLSPPLDTEGNADPRFPGVGVHDAHDTQACDSCHVVPSTPDAPGHLDPLPAEVVWGGLALADGAAPTWDGVALTCAGTYCHGGTLSGGTDPVVSWVDTELVLACTSCHGNPPPAPHTSNPDCVACHPDQAEGLHRDGELQTELADCGGCHGTSAEALAPPPDSQGGTEVTLPSVGAHAAHVSPGFSAPVACGDCHVVPAKWRDAGHIDPAPAEVVFAGLASNGPADPRYEPGPRTCGDTYCHAPTSDGTDQAPVWTVVDGSQIACTGCHGMGPEAPHPPSAPGTCVDCHDRVVDGDDTIVDPAKHVNGIVEVF